MAPQPKRWPGRGRRTLLVAIALSVALGPAPSTSARAPKFFDDDPLAREPETRDASGAKPYDINLAASLLINLFISPSHFDSDVRAGNVNTIDEVPDSSWFTNRLYRNAVSVEEIARGPNTIDGPAPPPWTVIGAKTAGAAPGFRVRDARGEQWFLSLDAKGWPRAATGAIAVATRLFWALGYNQIESYLASFHPRDLRIDAAATVEPRAGYERPMRKSDIDAVLMRAAKNDDGSYRVSAARALPGRVLGAFRYYGTRPDDPNDLIPHEHRRELRALKVFGAWVNLVDLKSLNTLDTLVSVDGRSVIRHYLQDVGSTFGIGANGPHEWDQGHEYLAQTDLAWRRLVTFGFYLQPWQTIPFYEHPELGRIERPFEPERWKPRVAAGPLHTARDDDTFWAALRVAAFSEELIRAAVAEARYVDPAATEMLATILIERRNAIARSYLTKVTPLVGFALDDRGTLTFENAAARAGVGSAPAGGYRAVWSAFDNLTQASEPLGETPSATGSALAAPAALSRVRSTGAFVKVTVIAIEPAHPEWRPIDVYFRRQPAGWQLVGVER